MTKTVIIKPYFMYRRCMEILTCIIFLGDLGNQLYIILIYYNSNHYMLQFK